MFATEPLAYLLTWTCKGTRLHGDERGSVDCRHNVYGTPVLPPDPRRQEREHERLSHPAILLDADSRQVVDASLAETAGYRGWTLCAKSARTNHVHVVIAAPGRTPEDVMDALKAWATRRLREAGRIRPDVRPWTRHGSTPYLWTEEQVAAAVAYVNEAQDIPH